MPNVNTWWPQVASSQLLPDPNPGLGILFKILRDLKAVSRFTGSFVLITVNGKADKVFNIFCYHKLRKAPQWRFLYNLFRNTPKYGLSIIVLKSNGIVWLPVCTNWEKRNGSARSCKRWQHCEKLHRSRVFKYNSISATNSLEHTSKDMVNHSIPYQNDVPRGKDGIQCKGRRRGYWIYALQLHGPTNNRITCFRSEPGSGERNSIWGALTFWNYCSLTYYDVADG